jgi:hypothetical protein
MEVRGADRYGYNLDSMNLFIAKECAKVAVLEAENSEYNVLIAFGFVANSYRSTYWKSVMDELNNIKE